MNWNARQPLPVIDPSWSNAELLRQYTGVTGYEPPASPPSTAALPTFWIAKENGLQLTAVARTKMTASESFTLAVVSVVLVGAAVWIQSTSIGWTGWIVPSAAITVLLMWAGAWSVYYKRKDSPPLLTVDLALHSLAVRDVRTPIPLAQLMRLELLRTEYGGETGDCKRLVACIRESADCLRWQVLYESLSDHGISDVAEAAANKAGVGFLQLRVEPQLIKRHS